MADNCPVCGRPGTLKAHCESTTCPWVRCAVCLHYGRPDRDRTTWRVWTPPPG